MSSGEASNYPGGRDGLAARAHGIGTASAHAATWCATRIINQATSCRAISASHSSTTSHHTMHLLYNYIQTLRTYGYLVATPLYLPINMPYLTCKDKVDTVFILCLYVQVDNWIGIFHNKLQTKIGQSKFNFFFTDLPTYPLILFPPKCRLNYIRLYNEFLFCKKKLNYKENVTKNT